MPSLTQLLIVYLILMSILSIVFIFGFKKLKPEKRVSVYFNLVMGLTGIAIGLVLISIVIQVRQSGHLYSVNQGAFYAKESEVLKRNTQYGWLASDTVELLCQGKLNVMDLDDYEYDLKAYHEFTGKEHEKQGQEK